MIIMCLSFFSLIQFKICLAIVSLTRFLCVKSCLLNFGSRLILILQDRLAVNFKLVIGREKVKAVFMKYALFSSLETVPSNLGHRGDLLPRSGVKHKRAVVGMGGVGSSPPSQLAKPHTGGAQMKAPI